MTRFEKYKRDLAILSSFANEKRRPCDGCPQQKLGKNCTNTKCIEESVNYWNEEDDNANEP